MVYRLEGEQRVLSTMKLTRENLHIVLVDDDDADCELLRIALVRAGFKYPLTHFRNGGIALEYFKYINATGAFAPHVVLLDLNMPRVNGVNVLHRLREASSFRDMPVIILTGSDVTTERPELAHLGIFRFLKKQSDGANVISALDDFVGLYNLEARSLVA